MPPPRGPSFLLDPTAQTDKGLVSRAAAWKLAVVVELWESQRAGQQGSHGGAGREPEQDSWGLDSAAPRYTPARQPSSCKSELCVSERVVTLNV